MSRRLYSKQQWKFQRRGVGIHSETYIFSASEMIEITAFLTAYTFNEECILSIKIMEMMGINIGPQAKIFIE